MKYNGDRGTKNARMKKILKYKQTKGGRGKIREKITEK